MLSREQNERLTQVGPGTPGGELLRRYWQVLCPTKELACDVDRKRVRLLGEDLLVFRDARGEFRCVQERCPHRSASLYFGFIEPDGMRCCYHGWKFDCASGRCVERPFETTPPHEGIMLTTYPVEALGGLLFVYMGPHTERPPLLPRWDVLAREDKPKQIRVMPDHHCNWLQIQENTADSVHTYYLHGHRAVMMARGNPDRVSSYFYRPIKAYDWKVSEWGIEKMLEYGGENPEVEVRPPLIFPNVLRIPEGPIEAIHFRIPIDDEHTRIIWLGLFDRIPGSELTSPDKVPYTYEFDAPGITIESVDLSTFYGQDRVVWETQGAITDRSVETLGATDRGIVLFRRMLAEQIDRVERGEEPTVAVVHDPAENVCITFEVTKPWFDMSSAG
jgi:5,5'-dehydrodivanillate O-demethylase oxygenase subunit